LIFPWLYSPLKITVSIIYILFSTSNFIWEIWVKDTKGTPFGVHINAIMATKEWMEDINMYFKVWCDWAKKNPGVVKKAPPEVALPPERPPHRRSRPATKGSLPVIDL